MRQTGNGNLGAVERDLPTSRVCAIATLRELTETFERAQVEYIDMRQSDNPSK